MARAKKVDAPIVYEQGKEAWVLFGWCTTGHHKDCRVEFPGHKCKCECHVNDKK